MNENVYETPRVVEIEILVEQAILNASGQPGSYPSWGEEDLLY